MSWTKITIDDLEGVFFIYGSTGLESLTMEYVPTTGKLKSRAARVITRIIDY